MTASSNRQEVLIIGAGFLGSRLYDHLRAKHWNTTLASRSRTKTSGTFYKLDLLDQHSVLNVIKANQPNFIVMTAFDFSCDKTQNLNMVENLIRAASALKQPPRLIYYSTSAEYGSLDSDVNSFTENSPLNPQSAYGEIKALISRRLSAEFEKLDILRIFNPYSPQLPERYFVGRIWREIQQTKLSKNDHPQTIHLKYHSDIRDYFNLNYLFEVTAALFTRKEPAGILNIASGKGITIADLTEAMIARYCPGKLVPQLDASFPISALPYSVGSVTKLKSLGIRPGQLEI